MIEQLTPEQIARFPEFVDKWTRVELSCEPADRPRAEAAIRSMYEVSGLAQPEKIVWYDSPKAMCIEHCKPETNRSVRDTIKNQIRHVTVDVMRRISNHVRASIMENIDYAIEGPIKDVVRDAILDTAGVYVWQVIYGPNEACQLAVYDFCREVLGLVNETNMLASWFELAQSCGWIMPYEKVCYVSERHCIINQDEGGAIHCEDGPSISYPDGWSIYADHGTILSKEVVTDPDRFTLEELKDLSPVEVKIILKKLGMEKFLSIPGTMSDTWTDLFGQIAKETIND
jgi:hypothetical protein